MKFNTDKGLKYILKKNIKYAFVLLKNSNGKTLF